jgi:two-component system, cell cycle sensor histidine kinase and response regulator CckA
VIQDDIHFAALKELTDRFNISCRFIEAFEYEDLFEMLQANFVQAGVVNRLYANRHYKEYSVAQTPVIFNPIEMRFGATKDKHQDILMKIDSYMLSYSADGHSIYFKLLNRWFNGDTKKVFPRWFVYSFIAVAGATILFFGAALLFRRQVQRRTEELTNTNLLLESQILERTKAQKALLSHSRFEPIPMEQNAQPT